MTSIPVSSYASSASDQLLRRQCRVTTHGRCDVETCILLRCGPCDRPIGHGHPVYSLAECDPSHRWRMEASVASESVRATAIPVCVLERHSDSVSEVVALPLPRSWRHPSDRYYRRCVNPVCGPISLCSTVRSICVGTGNQGPTATAMTTNPKSGYPV